MNNNETPKKAQNPLMAIFFDANLPCGPLREYLACIEPYARLWFTNEPNYFTLHPNTFEPIKNRFLSNNETPFLHGFFQKIQTSRPTIMKDHELYLYIGMLAELFYPEVPCVFFTGDRRRDKKNKAKKPQKGVPHGQRTVVAKKISHDSPRVFRVFRILDKEGVLHDEFKIQPHESQHGFPQVLRREFEEEGYQGIVLRNIPIIQVGTHGSDVAHRIIAEQIIAWFNRVTGQAIVPLFSRT